MRFLVLLAVFALHPATVSAQQLRIYFIDVDQADATLIVSPSGQTLLVDSGRNTHGPRLQAAMATAGVTQIDHFVATHYHEDHYGGVDDLVEDENVTVVPPGFLSGPRPRNVMGKCRVGLSAETASMSDRK